MPVLAEAAAALNKHDASKPKCLQLLLKSATNLQLCLMHTLHSSQPAASDSTSI
jgi:hypothetical protein